MSPEERAVLALPAREWDLKGPPGIMDVSKNADGFAVCPDRVAVDGMRLLAAPAPGDRPVVSGESGAVTAGLVAALLGDPSLREIAGRMGLGADSRVLLLSTEGDADPRLYRRLLTG